MYNVDAMKIIDLSILRQHSQNALPFHVIQQSILTGITVLLVLIAH